MVVARTRCSDNYPEGSRMMVSGLKSSWIGCTVMQGLTRRWVILMGSRKVARGAGRYQP